MEQNKTSKYFKYAIGEIILVVIGILIALQINNWNEHRKGLIKEKETLYKFLQDLKSDSTYYQINFKRILSIDSLHKELYLVGFEGKQSIEHSTPNYIRRSLIYNPIARENDPNITNKIDNDKIREEIQIYFRSMSSVEEAQLEHENVVFKIRDYFRKNRVHNVQNWFKSEMLTAVNSEITIHIIEESSLITLSKNEDFQQLLFESSVKINETKQSMTQHILDNTRLMSKIKDYIYNND